MKTRRGLTAWRLLVPVSLGLAAGSALAFKPAEPKIIQCPDSSEFRRVEGMASGNTFGRRLWTDGFVWAPMLPAYPRISRCADGGRMFWVADRPVLGELPFWPEQSPPVPAEWSKAAKLRALGETEFLDAIDQGLGTTRERLLHLRLQAWWLANQAQRHAQAGGPGSGGVEGSPRARANLEALVLMLDESDRAEPLMKIEALRELGRPAEALALIERVHPGQPALLAWLNRLKELTASGDRRVAEVLDPPKP